MTIPTPGPRLLQLETARGFDGERIANEQDYDLAPKTRRKNPGDGSDPREPETDLADAKHGHVGDQINTKSRHMLTQLSSTPQA